MVASTVVHGGRVCLQTVIGHVETADAPTRQGLPLGVQGRLPVPRSAAGKASVPRRAVTGRARYANGKIANSRARATAWVRFLTASLP